MGIASLNPSTGLEEFGFFKKVGKFFKKVVKKVAPVAMLIPGVGTALGGVLGGIGGLATNIPGIGKALGTIGSTVASGIGSLNIPGISTIAQGTAGGFGGIADALTTREGLFGGGPLAELFGVGTGTSTEPGTGTGTSTAPGAEEQAQQQNILQRIINAKLMGDQGPNVGALGLAGLLGKLAYDEAKNRRGVPLTPMTQMDAMGRFNIEAEIARRMGQDAPNPVEFGLMPANTIPQLSGGRPEEPTGMYMGGPIMAFAEGGNVSDEDFKRKTGKINGPGTETSDDIPAMLSDGEFVFKSQSVRGAGAFDMNKKRGGIIELVPNKEESRERGTDLMYEMMDLFSSYAKKRA
jgi:hypothetical protein